MAKKILLIENDQAFAAQLSQSLEASGFGVRATGDGREGLDLARDWAPGAIVLCVELPAMSGYLVCQKLKKDEGLKGIPLVLTSAEATEETFEKHRTLKARADEYLLKPYEPEVLIDKLGALVGLPEPSEPGVPIMAEVEEIVDLDTDIGFGAAEGEPDVELPGLSLEALPDEPAAPPEPGTVEDDDLRLLDDAFDGLAAPAVSEDAAAALDELSGEKPVPGDEVDAAAATLPDEDERNTRTDLGGLDDEADAALGAFGASDETLSPGLDLNVGAPQQPAPSVRGASADLLRAAGIKLLDDDDDLPAAAGHVTGGDEAPNDALASLRADLAAREGEARDLRRELEAATRRADEADADLALANERAEKAQEKAHAAEAEAREGREEARRAAEQARAAEAEVAELRRKATDAEKRAIAAEADARRKSKELAAAANALGRAEALERELDELRTELLVARGEAEGARGEIERRTADLRKRVADLEAANAKNEERVVKAYQKIKADEKVRDKVRKALAIATQLLEDGLQPESAAEKDRAAAGGGRD